MISPRRKALRRSVSKHIEDLARERTIPVLLVDEAHLMHQDTLDHLHMLLNYAWDSKALLSLILIGLPDLNERLVMRRNRSLHSRLTHRLTIEPLSPDDTAERVVDLAFPSVLQRKRVEGERIGGARAPHLLQHVEAFIDGNRGLRRGALNTTKPRPLRAGGCVRVARSRIRD